LAQANSTIRVVLAQVMKKSSLKTTKRTEWPALLFVNNLVFPQHSTLNWQTPLANSVGQLN
jgi:hypothetical protein